MHQHVLTVGLVCGFAACVAVGTFAPHVTKQLQCAVTVTALPALEPEAIDSPSCSACARGIAKLTPKPSEVRNVTISDAGSDAASTFHDSIG